MDFVEEEFSAYKSSVSRMRWFMTIALLISVLIVFHIYLEQFGYQEQQMETVFGHRISNHVEQVQNCYKKLALHKQNKNHGLKTEFPKECNADLIPVSVLDDVSNMNLETLLRTYSKREFTIRRTDNTIAGTKLGIRKIPLLGVEVPANDFVTVMAIMSFVFVVGVWVNLQGVRASLVTLANRSDPELLKLAQLHAVFVSGIGLTRGNTLAMAARVLVFWLPLASISIASILGYWGPVKIMIEGGDLNYGPNSVLLIHIATSVIISGLHLWIALECFFEVREIRTIFAPKSQQSGPVPQA